MSARLAWYGEDWNGGIKKHFDDAVTKVLETWHGHSAEQFATAAQKISNNFAKLAPYPHNTGHVLHQISEHLADVKEAVDSRRRAQLAGQHRRPVRRIREFWCR